MARLPRLSLAGYPHYVIQRGKQSLFYADDDYRAYLTWLAAYSKQHGVAVHAYALLEQQTHLVLTPQTTNGVPQLMQALSRRYASFFNQFHRRKGSLWEARYKSTLLEASRYLLPTLVYLDQQAQAAHSPWSSHGYYSGTCRDALVTPPPVIWTLGNTPFAREQAYAQLVAHGLGPAMQNTISQASLKGWALGGDSFLQEIQALTPRPVSKRAAGRPKKPS